MSTLKITTPMARVLQALRAGPMDTSQMYERFGNSHQGMLVSAGFAELVSGYYKITAKGREACPNRRSNMPPVLVVPVVHRKRIDTPVKQPLPMRNEGQMTTPATTKTLLDLVILKNQISRQDIYANFGDENKTKTGKMLWSVTNNQLLKEDDDSIFRVGAKANDWLAKNTGVKAQIEPKPPKPFKIVSPSEMQQTAQKVQQNVGEVQQSETDVHKPVEKEHVPKFGTTDLKAFCDENSLFSETELLPNAPLKPLPEPSKPKIRFALTSDHTIIIMTDGYPVMELDEDQTEALVTFVEDVAMSIPAYTKHFVGGASL